MASHIILVVNIARQDEVSSQVLQSLIAAQLQLCPINKRKSSLLQVEVNYGLFNIGMQKQLASAESHLDETFTEELGYLRRLVEGCDEKVALFGCFHGVNYFLHVEATAIFCQNSFEHYIVSLRWVFVLYLALAGKFPELVGPLKVLDLVFFTMTVNHARSHAFEHNSDFYAITSVEHV